MAKKTKFTFTTADGITATRTSERPYTHVVVGRRDNVRERKAVRSKHGYHMENYAWWALVAATPVGEVPPGGYAKVTQKNIDGVRETLDAYADAQAYADATIASELAALGDGDTGPLTVLQWSMSENAAHRAVGGFSKIFLDVHVLPVSEGQPPASKGE
ncbi:hypothetical protein [Paraburkholderia sp. C35]|uniref:hypothetical protein n=1 Tax=Paraburkholderia sp. C35 TaxID=2126993 RepID=UPI000D69A5D2|nr:hypothetical protein [Paraburkholderia sp. C35]